MAKKEQIKNIRYAEIFRVIALGSHTYSEISTFFGKESGNKLSNLKNELAWLRTEGIITATIKGMGKGKGKRAVYDINIKGIFAYMKKRYNLKDYTGNISEHLEDIFIRYLEHALTNKRINKIAKPFTLFDIFESFVLGVGLRVQDMDSKNKNPINEMKEKKHTRDTISFYMACWVYLQEKNRDILSFSSFISSSI